MYPGFLVYEKISVIHLLVISVSAIATYVAVRYEFWSSFLSQEFNTRRIK